MTVTFYKNYSDNRVMNKNIEQIKTLENCNIKTNENILNINFTAKYSSDLLECNYIYIAELGRYYYADTVDLQVGNYITYRLNVDVLMSHKEKILQLVGTIARNENKSNGYLVDTEYVTKAYNQIVCKAFPNAINQDNIILMTVN